MSLDLDAIEARANAATPGPWERETGERERQYVAAVPMGGKRSYAIVADSGGRHPWADADFIAHARTDVPALIARVRELEAENAALKQRLVIDDAMVERACEVFPKWPGLTLMYAALEAALNGGE